MTGQVGGRYLAVACLRPLASLRDGTSLTGMFSRDGFVGMQREGSGETDT